MIELLELQSKHFSVGLGTGLERGVVEKMFFIDTIYFMVGNADCLRPLNIRLRNLEPFSIGSVKQSILLIDYQNQNYISRKK